MKINKMFKVLNKAKDIEILASCDTKKIKRRAENKAKNKLLNKVGFWSR